MPTVAAHVGQHGGAASVVVLERAGGDSNRSTVTEHAPPMNVCIAHGGDLTTPSGGTNRIAAIVRRLAEIGVDVTLVTARGSGTRPPAVADANVVEIPLANHGVRNQPQRAALVSWYARRIARRRDATLQIEHATLAGAATYLGCSDYVLDMHDLSYASPLYRDLPFGDSLETVIRHVEGRAVRRASTIVVVSERMRELVREVWDVPDDKLSVVPNGYRPEITRYRRPPDERVDGRVTFLGSLHPKLDTTAIKRLARSPSVSEMVVVGDGPAREELQHAADLPKLSVKGRLDDAAAYEYTASAEVAINPQYRSGLQEASSPVKLYEYAALGLPIVATTGPSFTDQIVAANAGRTVAPGASKQFVDAVESILESDDARDGMSANAERLAAGLDWPTRAAQFVDAAYSIS